MLVVLTSPRSLEIPSHQISRKKLSSVDTAVLESTSSCRAGHLALRNLSSTASVFYQFFLYRKELLAAFTLRRFGQIPSILEPQFPVMIVIVLLLDLAFIGTRFLRASRHEDTLGAPKVSIQQKLSSRFECLPD